MNQQLYRLLFDATRQELTLAEATLKAKRAIGDLDIRRTWILPEDPTVRLTP